METRKSLPVEKRVARTDERPRGATRATREGAGSVRRPGDLMQLGLGFATQPSHLPPPAYSAPAPAPARRAARQARGSDDTTAPAPARAGRSGPLAKHTTATTLPSARTTPTLPRATHDRPAATSASAINTQRQFGELREALADGWEIVQPIFARPLWSAPDDSATAFNFVLRSPRGTRLITVPQGRPVERFIRDRQLTVDYAR